VNPNNNHYDFVARLPIVPGAVEILRPIPEEFQRHVGRQVMISFFDAAENSFFSWSGRLICAFVHDPGAEIPPRNFKYLSRANATRAR
jgi:hypothetical protein